MTFDDLRPALALWAACWATVATAAFPLPPGSPPSAYADAANWPDDPLYPAQTPLHSFYVADAGAVSPDERALGPGARLDRAFSYTRGDPRVRIAILSTGARWDDRDLVSRYWLSRGELPAPQDDAGVALPGADPHDRNGDGRFNVQDYTSATGAAPPAIATVVDPRLVARADRGDANGNGLLDPQDLLRVFGDGVDGDGNGYVDDVCGFDLLFDDPDAEDDLGGASAGGTEASLAAAAVNDGFGRVGACPECSIVPLRVGTSRRVSPNKLGAALVYVGGAAIDVAALGVESLADTPFLRDSARFAQTRGTLLVASGPDLPLRSESLPSSLPGVFVVRPALPSPAGDSFLDAERCGARSGTASLSAPAAGCGAGLAGYVAGIAGLVKSAGVDAGEMPGAESLAGLLKASASAVPGVAAGSLRHGAGRIDAERAVLLLREGKIAPGLTVTAPRAHSALFESAVAIAIELRAAGPTEVVASWAEGREPAPGAFAEFARLGFDGGLYAGPLGTFEPAGRLDAGPSYAPVPFSIRLRATSYFPDAGGEVVNEVRLPLEVRRAPVEMIGFPKFFDSSLEASPKAFAFNPDGDDDVVVASADGRLSIFSATGESRRGFPLALAPLDDRARHPQAIGHDGGLPGPYFEAILGTPAIADLDGDGRGEVVAGTLDGRLFAVDSFGNVLPGFPVDARGALPCFVPIGCPPTGVQVVSQDPPRRKLLRREVEHGFLAAPLVVPSPAGPLVVAVSLDGRVHVVDPLGVYLPGFPFTIESPVFVPVGADQEERQTSQLVAAPAVGDFDQDGWPEVVLGSTENYGLEAPTRGYLLHLSPPRLAAGWPVSLRGAGNPGSPLLGRGVTAGPVVADLDDDGSQEILFQSVAGPVEAFDFEGRRLATSAPRASLDRSELAAGRLTASGPIDVASISASAAATTLHLQSLEPGGFDERPAFPVTFEAPTRGGTLLADVGAPEGQEVVTVDVFGGVHSLSLTGEETFRPPLFAVGEVTSGPSFSAMQGSSAVLVGTRRGVLHAFRAGGRTLTTAWASPRHDPANSANTSTVLPDRAVSGIGEPVPPLPGGCCSQVPTTEAAFTLAWALLLLRGRAKARSNT